MADSADFDLLEERLLAYPALAIGQCRRVLRGMSKNVRKNVGRALDLVDGYERERYNKVQSKEELIDKYETKIGEYLMQLTKREMYHCICISSAIWSVWAIMHPMWPE